MKEQDSDNIIVVDKIVTRFGDKTVHDGVSFSIARGSIVAIIGGSGTGKSVLFREMLGLLRPTAGSVQILGTSVWEATSQELAELRTHFGVLFQNGALFSALNVRENIAVPILEQLTLPEAIVDTIIDSKILLSGLTLDAGEKMPSELSGGMRKRAALARALALEPEIVFLDEPTSGLDPVNARAFDELIRILSDNLGLTVCIITHDLTSIRTIAEQIIVLGEGRVIASGSYREIIRDPHPWIQEYFSADRNEETD